MHSQGQLNRYQETFNEITSIQEFFNGAKKHLESRYWGMDVTSEDRVEVVDVGRGDKCLKISVKDNDRPFRTKFPLTRAEIRYRSPNHFTNGEYYYSWKFLIPENELFEDDLSVGAGGKKSHHFIAQWHDPTPKNKIDTENFNQDVPIFLEYRHDTTNNSNKRRIWLKFRPTTQNNGYQIMFADIIKGQWTEIVLYINWAADNSGFIEAWINGKQLVEFRSGETQMRGPNLKKMKNGQLGSNYFRVGHYRRGHSKSHTLYFDEFSFGKSFDDLLIRP